MGSNIPWTWLLGGIALGAVGMLIYNSLNLMNTIGKHGSFSKGPNGHGRLDIDLGR